LNECLSEGGSEKSKNECKMWRIPSRMIMPNRSSTGQPYLVCGRGLGIGGGGFLGGVQKGIIFGQRVGAYLDKAGPGGWSISPHPLGFRPPLPSSPKIIEENYRGKNRKK
jgi:hypothetical protein